VTKLVDKYFDEKPVPDIVYGLSPPFYSKLFPSNILNKINSTKLVDDYLKFMDGFQAINQQIRTIFNCEMRNELLFEDCARVRHSFIDIINYNEPQREAPSYLTYSNESIIRNFKILSSLVLYVRYPQINLRNNALNFNVSQRILTMDKSFWKQRPIIEISSNSSEVDRNYLYIATNKNYLKNFKTVSFFITLNTSAEFTLTKNSFQFLEFPYKSRCSYYESRDTIFSSLSHEHCVRNCLRNYCEIKMNCSCFVTILNEKVIEIRTNLDENNNNICSNNNNLLSFYKKYEKFCTNLCPIDCIDDEFIITNKHDYKNPKIDSKIWKLKLFWYDSKPLIINRETPVITFTDYFCYIGGLFGMWFGINANQLFEKLKENIFVHFNTFIGFCLFFINIFKDIIIIVRTRIYGHFRNISYIQEIHYNVEN
jgi:hypothetical protein